MPAWGDRLKHAWNAFLGRDGPKRSVYGESSYTRPDKIKLRYDSDRTIINAIYTRISVDCAQIEIRHVRKDQNGRYTDTIDSSLNECLTTSANKDQSARAFRQDMYMTLLDEGCVAIVPVDTSVDPRSSNSYEIESMRIGIVRGWLPDSVIVDLYNDRTGRHEELELPKKMVCIVENPFYSIFNEPNSILQRLKRKLVLLDAVDEQSGSGKLDMIIQLPYTIRSEARRAEADKRRKDVEMQLQGSKYGVAYIDATEHITQLNRPIENTLMTQVQYLMDTLHSQLGLTPKVFDGTADEKEMLNYTNRTLEPIVDAVVSEIKRKWLTKTARTQGQSIMFFKDTFKLVPAEKLAELVDKFTRNAVMSSNEWRSILGLPPSDDPDADALRNKNLNQTDQEIEKQDEYPIEPQNEGQR